MVDPLNRLKIVISSSTPVVVIETVEETSQRQKKDWRRGRDSTYPKFCKLLIPANIASNTHEYRGFFAFRPFRCFRPVRPVEPISAFYGQDGQEAYAVCLRQNYQ
jgi:hypothetical protein